MSIFKKAAWITSGRSLGDICPCFRKHFNLRPGFCSAVLRMTALGVYRAELNGEPVSRFVLAPGWTSYEHRLQVQTYDVSQRLYQMNELQVTVGRGWFASRMADWGHEGEAAGRRARPDGLIAELEISYPDGSQVLIATDASWEYAASPIRFSEIYDGESYDASGRRQFWCKAALLSWPRDILIPQEGEEIREQEVLPAKSIFRTPKGETVVDFGQNISGYVKLRLKAKRGDEVLLSHAEVLDAEGNFYTDNYRSAKAKLHYICGEGEQTYHPLLTFFGFRYIRLDKFPGEPQPEMFKAVAVYSALKQTGFIESGHAKLNQLISNIFWGQRGNFLDVPTDCPQRDERLGWTGDAQNFVKTAAYNFDVERFFRKWLRDLRADQAADGAVPDVIPDYLKNGHVSAGWADAAVICPWQLYLIYGDKTLPEEQFSSMQKWADYIPAHTQDKYLWTGGEHFGDWLGLDAPAGSYKGSSRPDLIASAFYAHTVDLLIRTGRALGKDMSVYEALYPKITAAFRAQFPTYKTQTEHALAICFELSDNPAQTAADLARLLEKDGGKMQTGFIGTPYLLHALSRHGYTKQAYDLLLREDYPSWLYQVNKGATTIWEHWDGIKEDGSFWSADMNSFNHYSYGCVADWIYEEAAGIRVLAPGFGDFCLAPKPDRRLGFLDVRFLSRRGLIRSAWFAEEDGFRYEFTLPQSAEVIIGGQSRRLEAGCHTLKA